MSVARVQHVSVTLGQRLEGAGAVQAVRQREHVRVVWLEPGGRRLQDLDRPLIEQKRKYFADSIAHPRA